MASTGMLTRRPLYLQVRDALLERIASGEWKAGTAIPNEADLAREFGVSSGTMRKALDMMEGERVLTRRQGRGTFVNDQGSDEVTARFNNICGVNGERVSGNINAVEITECPSNELERVRLRLGEHDLVYRIRCIRSYEGQPLMVEESSMPAGLFPGLAEANSVAHSIVVLAQRHGILLGKATERISIGEASSDIAEVLGIAPAAPIMVLDRLTRSLDGLPIEWRVGRCRLTAHHYLVEMP